jgi:glutamate synthase (NADPH) large chain
VHHFALLLGYGASVINPYLAFAAIDQLVKDGKIDLEYKEARKNYIKAIDKGLLKVFSKMGISTLRSYHGAQIFESVGVTKILLINILPVQPLKLEVLVWKKFTGKL